LYDDSNSNEAEERYKLDMLVAELEFKTQVYSDEVDALAKLEAEGPLGPDADSGADDDAIAPAVVESSSVESAPAPAVVDMIVRRENGYIVDKLYGQLTRGCPAFVFDCDKELVQYTQRYTRDSVQRRSAELKTLELEMAKIINKSLDELLLEHHEQIVQLRSTFNPLTVEETENCARRLFRLRRELSDEVMEMRRAFNTMFEGNAVVLQGHAKLSGLIRRFTTHSCKAVIDYGYKTVNNCRCPLVKVGCSCNKNVCTCQKVQKCINDCEKLKTSTLQFDRHDFAPVDPTSLCWSRDVGIHCTGLEMRKAEDTNSWWTRDVRNGEVVVTT
jgi:hypothetical protein